VVQAKESFRGPPLGVSHGGSEEFGLSLGQLDELGDFGFVVAAPYVFGIKAFR
jgi:hypothetical protein